MFRTNARENQTYDHIAFFLGEDEEWLPNDEWIEEAGVYVDGFDYGVFDFPELFAQALHGSTYELGM